MKKIQLIAISSATLLASSMSFAETASVDIHISAQVPISCSANLNVNVVQISANEFKIGELDRQSQFTDGGKTLPSLSVYDNLIYKVIRNTRFDRDVDHGLSLIHI